MPNIVIKIENLYKEYRLGVIGHGTLHRDLQSWWANVLGKEDPNSLIDHNSSEKISDHILALNDINLEVREGDVLGIIGKNGAGKSTLLKILSRVTAPTKGHIKIKGRIAGLLEVGTGFHPELTGRENIYLNGAINGMNKKEVTQKVDQIVAFAGVEQFLDTPVKRYSSGMYVRLAFAVAAHLEPEILLVDEVLAVGDVDFQKKCISKMGDMSREGRTVLLVSHNMASIMNLCKRVILLDEGRIVKDGQAAEVVQQYISIGAASGGEMVWPDIQTAPGNSLVRLRAVRILQEGIEGATGNVDISKELIIQIVYQNLIKGTPLYSAIWLRDKMGIYVLSSANLTRVSLTKDPWYGKPHPLGLFKSVCCIPANFLNDGRYSITAIVGKVPNNTQVLKNDVVYFDVHDTGEMRKEFYKGWLGVVRPKLAWRTENVDLAEVKGG